MKKIFYLTSFVSLFFSFNVFAQGVNFTELQHCYDWTNLGLRSNEAQGYRNSQFVGLVKHGTSATANINALIYQQENPDRVSIIQAGESITYSMTSPNISMRNCQDSATQDLVVPVQGHLNAGTDSTNLTTHLSLRAVRHRSTDSTSTELCPIDSARVQRSWNGTGRVIPDSQVEEVVRQAILDRLNWIAANVSSSSNRTVRDNITRALRNQGACFKVVPEFPGLVEARDRVLCNIGVQAESTCASAGDNPAPQRTEP